MHRPAHYETKNGKAIVSYLASVKDSFVTAAQIIEHLQKRVGDVSRPTVYRQLEKLITEGKVRKYVFDGSSVTRFQYIEPDESKAESCHLKCEVCDGVFNLECNEVYQISRHISENHNFRVNESKTVFYGKCKMCLQEAQQSQKNE